MLTKAESNWSVFEAAHLLNRAGFGGSPEEIKDFHAMGREKAVESLLAPSEALDAYPVPKWCEPEVAAAAMREKFKEKAALKREMAGMTPEQAAAKNRELRQKEQREVRAHGLEAQAWWFRRMLESKAPLREKMTLFWHDHFATSIQKVRMPVLMVRQNTMFREQALGSFRDLTQKVLLDPAMMLYLDTQSSKKGKPNENFAREVMELFTLGEGSYTEQDIHEAARAFTGYQINRSNGTVYHNKKMWDDGEKTIFGKTGKFTGREVIDLIFEQPRPARFMAGKLWEFFVQEKPDDALVAALGDTYQKSGCQTGALLKEIFLSQEFYAESVMRGQIKSPVQYLVSLIKQLEIKQPPMGFALAGQLQLGQVLFLPPNVAGWDWGQAWINTNTLLTRYNFAGYLTTGASGDMKGMSMESEKVKGIGKFTMAGGGRWKGPDYEAIAPRPLREKPDELVDMLVFRFFQNAVPEKARHSFAEYANSKKGVVFTNHEVAELCHLMLSTPYYQLC